MHIFTLEKRGKVTEIKGKREKDRVREEKREREREKECGYEMSKLKRLEKLLNWTTNDIIGIGGWYQNQ